jgi:hypothetical protein
MYTTPKKRGRPFRKDVKAEQPKTFAKIPISALLCNVDSFHFGSEVSPVKNSPDLNANYEWSTKKFTILTLRDKAGNEVHWLDLYYMKMHSLLGVLPRSILDRHFYDFPPMLYHSMLATCFDQSDYPFAAFESHHNLSANRPTDKNVTLYDVLIDIHVFAFHYLRNQIDAAMLTIMKMLTACRLLGLPHSITRTTRLPPEVEHELDARSWIYLYMVDYFSSVVLRLPCVVQEHVPAHMLHFFTHTAYANSLHPPDNHLSYSFHFVPLFKIGRKQLVIQRLPNDHSKESRRKEVIVELEEWKLKLPKLVPFPAHPISYVAPTSIWDTYLLSMYHYLYLMAMKDELISLVEHGIKFHSVLQEGAKQTKQLSEILKGTKLHCAELDRLPGMMGQCIFIGGVFGCALALWEQESMQLVEEHISLLESVNHLSSVFDNAQDLLVQFRKTPQAALEYLKAI